MENVKNYDIGILHPFQLYWPWAVSFREYTLLDWDNNYYYLWNWLQLDCAAI